MDGNTLAALAGQFGPMGLFVGYLIWERRSGAEERIKHDIARVEADKALAQSLGALTAVIQRLDR
jgi:hypothetical protein